MAEGLRFAVHRGDGAALLAFDVNESLVPDLAGFAVECSPPRGKPYQLLNRLSFAQEITAETKPSEREWTPTDQAPIQKFHWVHYPKDVPPGQFTYRATAMLFRDGEESALKKGPSAQRTLELRDEGYGDLELGFTRGYLSSQAYAERFDNAPISPTPSSGVFKTAPYEEQYSWLGSHARKLLFELIDETVADRDLSLDVFAYDFDEPDVARRLASLRSRLRLYLDDSDIRKRGGGAARKAEALALVEKSVGPDQVKRGHFSRFSHGKILIQKRKGVPVKVLAGSANFSIRGLYVQSNNVFVFADADVAAIYEQAFEQAWDDARGFRKSPIASGWFPEKPIPGKNLPSFQVSFAPHLDSGLSLQPVADAIAAAKSSVLFAIMDLDGGGPVLQTVRELPKRKDLYAFGTTQSVDGSLEVTSPGSSEPVFVPFGYLHSKVPEPFREETQGGAGIVIHHKFVVVDFNGDDPAVFAGSSNLAAGGEEENGDNLLAFRDPAIASTYAVEAIRLIDHYRFRAAMKESTKAEPLRLRTRSERWAAPYFERGTPKFRERVLFADS
jgi:phosphatidylserine/phosphatidylglycerophosphate/cardiolipin synthase-like enzyme